MGLADPELSVLLTDDEHIRVLNAQWRNEDQATDVLSFPLFEAEDIPDNPFALGDIVISLEYAERLVAEEAHRARVAESLDRPVHDVPWGLEQEVDFLVIHGLLHLMGHDHLEAEEEAEMRSEERRLWADGLVPMD